MNILLFQFPEDKKNFIKGVLTKTSFKDAVFYESENLSESKKALFWNGLDIILCYGDPTECINIDLFTEVNIKKPILFITEESKDFNSDPTIFSNSPDYLPFNEITSFTYLKNSLLNKLRNTNMSLNYTKLDNCLKN